MRLIERGRTRLIGATVGTCLVTAIGVTGAIAQDATPVPSGQATPSTQSEQPATSEHRVSAAEKTALAEQVQRVTDTIATVQQDRDSVAGTADLAAVDDLLAKATKLRDAGKATLDGDDVSAAPRQLLAAHGAAMAAESLLRAQLADYGLPSQQAGASRTLVAAYNHIDEISKRANEGTDEDANNFATTAQSLYKTAYDLYNAGTYAQAARTAEVAAHVARIADLLTAPDVFSAPQQHLAVVGPEMGRPGFGPEGGEHRVRGAWGPPVEAVPALPDGGEIGSVEVFAIGPRSEPGGLGGFGPFVAANGPGDFSTDTPLEVPAPTFD
ncbi:MAG: hypothetical protein QOF73_4739 [Thermomicrobiales bacterium]|nr:hypothetical protein [Thermomicrobiales bacterium]